MVAADVELDAATAAAAAVLVEQALGQLAAHDLVGNRVGVLLVDVAGLTDAALEVDTSALLDHVRGGVEIRRARERDRRASRVAIDAVRVVRFGGGATDVSLMPEMSWRPNNAWIRSPWGIAVTAPLSPCAAIACALGGPPPSCPAHCTGAPALGNASVKVHLPGVSPAPVPTWLTTSVARPRSP